MRIRAGLVLGVVLALAVAGCGAADGDDGVATAGKKPTASSSAKAEELTNEERSLKFGQCMRDNGLPDFKDPEVGDGGMRVEMSEPQGGTPISKETVDAAMEKCKQYLPGGGEPPKLDAAAVERLRKFAQCMRENGIENFPDPSDEGGFQIDGNQIGMNPDDPKFKAAEEACSQYQPSRPPGDAGPGTNTRRNG